MRRGKSGKVVLFILLLVLFFFAGLWIIESSLSPTIKELAEAKVRWAATEAINNGIKEKFSDDLNTQDLIFMQKDAQGRIVLVQPNVTLINILAAEVTLVVQDALMQLADDQFAIPLGQILGSELLANYGPGINVSIYPVGTLETRINDRFEEAGINQTRHRLYLDIEGTVKVVVPLLTSDVKIAVQVPLADTLIVGEVPGTYLNFSPNTNLE